MSTQTDTTPRTTIGYVVVQHTAPGAPEDDQIIFIATPGCSTPEWNRPRPYARMSPTWTANIDQAHLWARRATAEHHRPQGDEFTVEEVVEVEGNRWLTRLPGYVAKIHRRDP